MPRFETVEIPFVTIDGRRALTGLQMIQDPWLAGFVKRFPHCFEYAPNMDAAFFIESESAVLKSRVTASS